MHELVDDIGSLRLMKLNGGRLMHPLVSDDVALFGDRLAVAREKFLALLQRTQE